MILLRYSPKLGQLIDAEGKGIGVVCVPVRATDAMLEASDREHSFGMQWRCALAAARPDLSAATVKVPNRYMIGGSDYPFEEGFNAALDAIK